MDDDKRRIMVAVDDTEASERACKWTMSNVLRPGDELHLFHVVPRPAVYMTPGADDLSILVQEHNPAMEHAYVDQARRLIKDRFVPLLQGIANHKAVQVEVVPFRTSANAVGEALCARGQAIHASALIMAGHNKGTIQRFLLGSTSDYCSKHYPLPLVITH